MPCDYNCGQFYVVAEYFANVGEYNIITPKNQSFIKGVDKAAMIFLRLSF
jgi:hypothetical protein